MITSSIWTKHPLLYESIEILSWFGEWRETLIENAEPDIENVQFLPREIWDDLQGLLLGLVCLSRSSLTRFAGSAIVQRRLNQDPCEHCFGHVRYAGGGTQNPTSFQSNAAIGVATDLRAVAGGNMNTNCGGLSAIDPNAVMARRARKRKQGQ